MKKLLLMVLLFATSSFAGVNKVDYNKRLIDQVSKTKSTIIYIGEDWCHYCRIAKRVLTKAAAEHGDKLHIIFVETDKIPNGVQIKVGDENIKSSILRLNGIPKFITKDIKTGKIFVGHGNPAKIVRELLGDNIPRPQEVP